LDGGSILDAPKYLGPMENTHRKGKLEPSMEGTGSSVTRTKHKLKMWNILEYCSKVSQKFPMSSLRTHQIVIY
jgi:hypothetical protein